MNNSTPILHFPGNYSIEVTQILGARSTPDKGGCLVWDGPLDHNGYGKFYIPKFVFGKKRMTGSHRAAWIAHKGPIPDALLQIDHLCFNVRCVNVKHLDLVTEEENLRRATSYYESSGGRPRYDSLEKHRCKTHGRTDGYLKQRKDGYFFWVCRHCQRVRSERYHGRRIQPRTARYCSIEGCGRKHTARGYCMKHYQWHRNNNLF